MLGVEVRSELSVLITSLIAAENLDVSLLSRTPWAEVATGMCISLDLIKQTLTFQRQNSMFSLRKWFYDHTDCENQHFDRTSAIHSSYIKIKKQREKKEHLTAEDSSLARATCETNRSARQWSRFSWGSSPHLRLHKNYMCVSGFPTLPRFLSRP